MKTLKHIILITLIFTSIFSCKKDDIDQSLVGKWEPTQISGTGKLTRVNDGESVSLDVDYNVIEFNDVIYEFKENPNTGGSTGSFKSETKIGNNPVETVTVNAEEEGEWTKSGDKLTFKSNENSFVDFTIVKLKDDELRMTTTITRKEETTTLSIDYTFNFVKK